MGVIETKTDWLCTPYFSNVLQCPACPLKSLIWALKGVHRILHKVLMVSSSPPVNMKIAQYRVRDYWRLRPFGDHFIFCLFMSPDTIAVFLRFALHSKYYQWTINHIIMLSGKLRVFCIYFISTYLTSLHLRICLMLQGANSTNILIWCRS